MEEFDIPADGSGIFLQIRRIIELVGLTKMEQTTMSVRVAASRIRARWPSCSAPMVGTNPILRPAFSAFAMNTLNPSLFLRISMVGQKGGKVMDFQMNLQVSVLADTRKLFDFTYLCVLSQVL